MSESIEKELDAMNFSGKLEFIKKKYKNKRIVLYGAGAYCEKLLRHYDLSKLNIVAIADKRFENNESEFLGYKAISPFDIKNQNPDIVLVCVVDEVSIEQYFLFVLFEKIGRFKFDFIFGSKKSLKEKIAREWECIIRCY